MAARAFLAPSVESQVRPNDVGDRRLLSAMCSIAREKFVLEAKRSLAFMDEAIELESEDQDFCRVLLPPWLLPRMIQHLELEVGHFVLDNASATGYCTAVVAGIAKTVVGLDCDAGQAEQASKALDESAIDNVVIVKGRLLGGDPNEGPYNAMLMNGAITKMPPPGGGGGWAEILQTRRSLERVWLACLCQNFTRDLRNRELSRAVRHEAHNMATKSRTSPHEILSAIL